MHAGTRRSPRTLLLIAAAVATARAPASANAERPRGVYAVTDAVEEPGETPKTAAAKSAPIFYMNRHGGTYHHASRNDSSDNATTIGAATSTIEPWAVSDAGWAEVMSCVSDKFARFGVEVTDVDPGETPHIESVVAGHPSDLGLADNIAGISPFTSNCSVIPRSVVFTFAELFGENNQFVCDVAAQEIAHSIGLDHEVLCEDPMSYLGCGAKTFQDVDAPCGESEERPCACGAATQNSVAILEARLGRSNPGPAPELSLVWPTSGARVTPGFEITVDAAAAAGIDEVRISIDGTPQVSLAAPPYVATIDAALEPGRHWIDVEAIDLNGSRSHVGVEVDAIDEDDAVGCRAAGGGAGGLPLPLAALVLVWLASERRRPAEPGSARARDRSRR